MTDKNIVDQVMTYIASHASEKAVARLFADVESGRAHDFWQRMRASAPERFSKQDEFTTIVIANAVGAALGSVLRQNNHLLRYSVMMAEAHETDEGTAGVLHALLACVARKVGIETAQLVYTQVEAIAAALTHAYSLVIEFFDAQERKRQN